MSSDGEAASYARPCADFPAPSGWSQPECFAQTVEIGELGVELVGLCARSAHGVEVTGSAADIAVAPLERAHFELLERMSLVDALRAPPAAHRLLDRAGEQVGFCAAGLALPQRSPHESWDYSRSNGVALGRSWSEACDAAFLELSERDRVLRSWYGESAPVPLAGCAGSALDRLGEYYRVERYAFAASELDPFQADVHVVGVLAFPRERGVAFAFGMGAAWDRERAIAKAERECLQIIGFLWGEEIPQQAPPLATNPAFHQATYLLPGMHDQLRAWLSGEHARLGRALEPVTSRRHAPTFVDLTPPELRERVAVARAIPDGEVPLTFGRGHPWLKRSTSEIFLVHPIA